MRRPRFILLASIAWGPVLLIGAMIVAAVAILAAAKPPMVIASLVLSGGGTALAGAMLLGLVTRQPARTRRNVRRARLGRTWQPLAAGLTSDLEQELAGYQGSEANKSPRIYGGTVKAMHLHPEDLVTEAEPGHEIVGYVKSVPRHEDEDRVTGSIKRKDRDDDEVGYVVNKSKADIWDWPER